MELLCCHVLMIFLKSPKILTVLKASAVRVFLHGLTIAHVSDGDIISIFIIGRLPSPGLDLGSMRCLLDQRQPWLSTSLLDLQAHPN